MFARDAGERGHQVETFFLIGLTPLKTELLRCRANIFPGLAVGVHERDRDFIR